MELKIDWPSRGHEYEKEDLNELFKFLNDSKKTNVKQLLCNKIYLIKNKKRPRNKTFIKLIT